MIPKVIHYCWFGRTKYPPIVEKCINSWRKYCPNYEIKLWNEENYDVYHCPFLKEAYDSKNWAFVSDYARACFTTSILPNHSPQKGKYQKENRKISPVFQVFQAQ